MGASRGDQHGAITTINVHHPNSSLKIHVAKATLGRTPNHLTLSTTSTLSVGSTGSQARLIQSSHAPSMYQPVMMKDLGKSTPSSSDDSDTEPPENKAGPVAPEENGGYAAMDRHLNAFDMAGNSNIVDYMQNLKVKHLEIQLSEEKQDSDKDKPDEGTGLTEGQACENVAQEGGGSDKKSVKPTVTKSQKERHNETQKSEKLILNIDSSEIETSTSPIKIIKIKSRSRSVSPRRPSAADGSKSPKGKEKATEGIQAPSAKTHGILKRSSSSKSVEAPDLLSTPTGILKRSLSPKDLAKLDGLSPRNSFDSRASPVRSPQSDYCHSPGSHPNTVIDNRSPVLIVKHKGRSATKTSNRMRSVSASASVCNSLDSESSVLVVPPNAKKKRSLSTSNFDQNQMSSMDSEMSLLSPSYYYNRSCFSSAASLTSGNNSFDNDLSSLHNSHERIMQDNPIVVHGHEYHRGRRSHSPGNEACLTKAIEQPTCMECFLQSRKVS